MNNRIFLILAAVLVGGCAQDWSIGYDPGRPAWLVPAPATGQYDLYSSSGGDAARSAAVLAGEPIGFARDAAGQLTAVAGPARWAIGEGKYRWFRPGALHGENEDWAAEQEASGERLSQKLEQVAELSGEVVLTAMIWAMEDFLSDALDDMMAGSQPHEHHAEHHHDHHRNPRPRPQTRPS